MTTGLLRHPHRKLTPGFRLRVQEAMRDRRPTGWMLALAAGFSHQAALSNVLHARRVPATPLNVERLQRVAELVCYSGALFLADEEDR